MSDYSDWAFFAVLALGFALVAWRGFSRALK